jgi:AraC-like DNA-binding protein
MTSLTLDWLHLVTLLGAIHGLVLAGALLSKRSNRIANRLMAALMVSFSIYLASSVYHAAGLEQRFPHFFGLGYPQIYLFGPLVYLYAVAAADRSRRFAGRDWLHFAPFVVSIVLGLPIYLASGPDKLAMYAQFLRGEVPLHLKVQDLARFASGIVYSAATLRFLVRHRERVKASYSSTERVNLQWLLWFGSAAAFVWLLAVSFQFLDLAGVELGRISDDTIAVAVAILVYGIGYRGMRQPEIFRFETAEYPIQSNLRADLKTELRTELTTDLKAHLTTDLEAGLTAGRYEKSGLGDREAERLRERLLALMDREKPWANSELTLADLAEPLGTSPHKLSEVLNTLVQQTFYDFVNGYRVREVQRRIAAGEAKRTKILALALDAGFASKSTFNTVFKKHTNLTPSDYRQAAGA